MGSFKDVFDPLDLEIMDRVYEVAWARAQAHEPSRNTASDGARQTALRRKIFGVARIAGPGHIDYDTLTEVVLATISEQPGLTSGGGRHAYDSQTKEVVHS